MKFSYNWLKELAKFKHSPKELSDLMVLHITEVESMEGAGGHYSGVIVTEILEIAAHPNADKLHLVTLDIGLGKRAIVVCGAQNIEVGQKVPLALVGAMLPGGELKPATIRGIESRGMICNGEELGVEEKSEGILVLPKTASVGKPVNETLSDSGDTILDLKILSNRPDYLSYIGIARDIAAVANLKWEMSLPLNYKESGDRSSDHISVVITDELLCPHYRAHFVSNLEVKESPQWLKDKLISSGVRPINNLVDISNLVMLETGQPIHIFDYAKVAGKKIVIRKAQAGEKLLTLDGVERELTSEILLIADKTDPIALAGIMGGELSAVSDLTREVVVEVANFNPVVIRRGSKALGLSTDASLRFERGLTPYLAELGMRRTLHLIQEIIPEVVIAKWDVVAGKVKFASPTIKCSLKAMNELLGTKLTAVQVANSLERLEFKVRRARDQLMVTPPPFRGDIKEMADVAEEVLRLYGADRVLAAMPTAAMLVPRSDPSLVLADQFRDYLIQAGFTETPGHCFIGADWATTLGLKLDDELKLSNPLNSSWTHLSPNLWSNLIRFAPKFGDEAKIFEINATFNKSNEVLPQEERSLALFVSCPNITVHIPDGSGFKYTDTNSYRVIRGVLEQLLAQVRGLKFITVPGSAEDFYINVSRIMAKEVALGSIEELSAPLANKLGLPWGGVWAELNLSRLNKLQLQPFKFRPFSRFPSSSFDLSIELSNSTSAGMLIDSIKSSSPLIRSVEVFDVYYPTADHRSLGLRVVMQSDDRTLTDGEITSLTSKVTNLVTTQYRGRIRGSQS